MFIVFQNALSVRELSLFKPLCCQQSQGDKNEVNVKDASKDRSTEIPVETSIRYLQSAGIKSVKYSL